MKPTDFLRSATSRLERAVTARDKVAAAIAAISIQKETNHQEIADLRLAYETAAADVALGSATQDQVDIARKQLDDAIQRRAAADIASESTAALRAGLERKLSAADAEIVQASEQARLAEVAYLEQELSAADKIYVNAALEVEAALQRISVCRVALGERKAEGMIGAQPIQQPTLLAAGPFSEDRVRALHGRAPGHDGSQIGRSFFARWDLSALHLSLVAEMEEAAQDHGLINRVRKVVAGAID